MGAARICPSPPLEPSRSRLSSPYGWRQRPSGRRFHHGIDLAARVGEPVRAVLPGVVTHATANGARGFGGYGHTVVLRHAGGFWTLHAHLSRLGVEVGQIVQAGNVVGYVGQTDGRDGRPGTFGVPPHLHFEVRTRSLPAAYGDGNLDPIPWLEALGIGLDRNRRFRIIPGSFADCSAQRPTIATPNPAPAPSPAPPQPAIASAPSPPLPTTPAPSAPAPDPAAQSPSPAAPVPSVPPAPPAIAPPRPAGTPGWTLPPLPPFVSPWPLPANPTPRPPRRARRAPFPGLALAAIGTFITFATLAARGLR